MKKVLLTISLLTASIFAALPNPTYYNSFDALLTDGKYGKALDLSSTAQYLASHNISDNSWSMSFWYNASTITSKYGLVVARSNGFGEANSGQFAIKIGVDLDESGDRGIGVTEFGVKDYDGEVASVSTGTWQHVVITVNETDVQVYVDGSLSAAFTLSQARTAPVIFGIGDGDNGGAYTMDELRFYDDVLSAEQVTELNGVNPLEDATVVGVGTSITGESSVAVGSTITLTTSLSSVSWVSSDAAVATVDASGVVTGVAEGTVRITAMDQNDLAVMGVATITVGNGNGGGNSIAYSVFQEPVEMTVYDMNGIKVHTFTSTSANWNGVLNSGSKAKPGIYFVKAGKAISHKVMITQ